MSARPARWRSAGRAPRSARASVRCGVKAFSSGAKPTAWAICSTAAWMPWSAATSPATPTQTTRGLARVGKPPSSPRVRANGGKVGSVAANCAWSVARRTGGVSPKKRRVRWSFSTAAQRNTGVGRSRSRWLSWVWQRPKAVWVAGGRSTAMKVRRTRSSLLDAARRGSIPPPVIGSRPRQLIAPTLRAHVEDAGDQPQRAQAAGAHEDQAEQHDHHVLRVGDQQFS